MFQNCGAAIVLAVEDLKIYKRSNGNFKKCDGKFKKKTQKFEVSIFDVFL